MKINPTYRVTSLLLALLIFISSTGISLSMHYCGNDLFEIAVLGKIEPCKKKEKIIRKADQSYFQKPGCCSFDEFEVNTSEDYQLSDYDDVSLLKINSTPTFVLVKNIYFNEFKTEFIDFRHFQPPPNIKKNDIFRHIESYLI